MEGGCEPPDNERAHPNRNPKRGPLGKEKVSIKPLASRMTEPSNGIVRGLIAEIATGGHMASSTEGLRKGKANDV